MNRREERTDIDGITLGACSELEELCCRIEEGIGHISLEDIMKLELW